MLVLEVGLSPFLKPRLIILKCFLLKVSMKLPFLMSGFNVAFWLKFYHGSFKGIKGEVINILGQSRLLVRIDSMNCSLYANIERDEVMLLEEKQIAQG